MSAGAAREQEDRVVRGLRLRLVLVLGLLGALAAGSYFLFRAQSAALGSSAGVINLCGRQRMLSQRAALLIEQLDDATTEPERQRLRGELRQIADDMESHARRLLGGGPALAPPQVRGLVFDSPHDLAGSLRRFIDGVRAAADPGGIGAEEVDPRVARTLEQASDGSIVAALDHVVDVMQAHSEAGVRRLRSAQAIAAVLFLGTLVVLITSVFRPALDDLRVRLAELRQSQEALHEQRQQLQLTFESAPLGIARCSMAGELLSANPALCKMLGRTVEELVGQAVESLLHPGDHALLVEALRGSTDRDEDRDSFTVRLRHRDGSWVSGALHLGLVPDEDGLPIGWIAHFEDRTRQLAAEEQARQDRERLAQLSRLHTLGEMAAGIAHEVNQPLTAIANYSRAGRRMLETGSAGAGGLESVLDKVGAQALRAGEVIRGLRAFVRHRQSRSETVDLNEIVRGAVALSLADARFVRIGIETRLAAGAGDVTVDPVQIQQVILNLIRNAIDALQPGCEDPVVVRTRGNGDGFVEVAVEDRGVGIPETDAPRMFAPFFTSKESGLGMGLAISRSIVTSHGGRIWWTPGSEGGTTFHFTLPAAATATPAVPT